MKRIRGGRGLGDSIYLQSVCRHLIETTGQPIQVASDWPDVFRPLGEMASVVPFTRARIDVLAHYARRKHFPETTQFEDCCIGAGIKGPVDLRLDWAPVTDIADRLPNGKPLVCVGLPRAPMGRTDGFGLELLPRREAYQAAVDGLRGRATLIQIGAGEPRYRLDGIDLDLAGRTTVAELLDVCAAADGFVGYVSFVLAIAEALQKPSLTVWARAGLRSATPYIRQINPGKIIQYKERAGVAFDDEPPDDIREVAHGFLQ